MPQNSVDLAGIFQTVTHALAENQQSLNQADEYNSDHGDNMVRTFQTITGALEQKKSSSASTALAYAAKQLSKNTASSSSQLYAHNLSQAATQLQGKTVDSRGAMELLQTLIGGGQSSQSSQSSGGADLLGSLLGGMTGGETPAQTAPQGGTGDLLGSLLGGLTGGETAPQSSSQGGTGDLLGALLGGMTGSEAAPQSSSQGGTGDLLGSLLGGLTGSTGSSSSSNQQSGMDLGDLLNGAMTFMQAKQSGGNTMTALVQAFMAASGMGNSSHRQQSTQIVVNSFLQALAKGAAGSN
jgi:hypothetical protein